MKSLDESRKNRSRTLDANPKSYKQMPLDVILRRSSNPDPELIPNKFDGQFSFLDNINSGQIIQRVKIKGYNKDKNINLTKLKQMFQLVKDVRDKVNEFEIPWDSIEPYFNAYFSTEEEFENLDQFMVSLVYDYEIRDNEPQKDWTTYAGWRKRAAKASPSVSSKPKSGPKSNPIGKKKISTWKTDTESASGNSEKNIVKLYRTMPLNEYMGLLNKRNNSLTGHLGDPKEALNYLYKKSTGESGKYRCLIAFVFSVPAITNLFKNAARPSKLSDSLQQIDKAMSFENPGFTPKKGASLDQGTGAGIGLKSEEHGDAKFSIAIGHSDGVSESFMSLVDKGMELIATNFMGDIRWCKTLSGEKDLITIGDEKNYLENLQKEALAKNARVGKASKEDEVLAEVIRTKVEEVIDEDISKEDKVEIGSTSLELYQQAIIDELARKSSETTTDKPSARQNLLERLEAYLGRATVIEPDARVEHTMDEQKALRIVGLLEPSGSTRQIRKKEKPEVCNSVYWNIEDCGAGGDCLFLSLIGKNDKKAAANLRATIVAYQRENIPSTTKISDYYLAGMLRSIGEDEMATRVADYENIPNDAYYDVMELQGTWGGPPEIDAYTAFSQNSVIVIDNDGTISQSVNGHTVILQELPSDISGIIMLFKTVAHYQRITGRKTG